ncbi:hypothetical protein KO497_18515 [Pacificibacter marinus]|nr:hypothetical protein [Pacificibacter marinus]
MAWERRRWLNSGMRLQGTPECRALYLDLIWISYDQAPVGTLPTDPAILAKILMVDRGHFEALCKLPFGPLHNWVRCECDGGEVRLMHGQVLRTLNEAMSRREDNRAKNEAANAAKRLQRLRSTLAGYDAKLVENDAAVRWIDEYLVKQGVAYRTSSVVEEALRSWSDHMLDLGMRRP